MLQIFHRCFVILRFRAESRFADFDIENFFKRLVGTMAKYKSQF